MRNLHRKKVKKRITNVIQKKKIEMIVVRSIGQKEYQG
jgi:predicted Fe-Mo cluster-binding NifX family protein